MPLLEIELLDAEILKVAYHQSGEEVDYEK
jgi:hypothetical protein